MFRTLLLTGLTLTAGAASAADWPQFLGPTRDGVSTEIVAPWTAPPKVLWRQPLGEAHSSPVVAGGIVYAFFKPANKNEDALAAFKADTGDNLWTKSYPRAAFTPPFGNGPRGTPAVDGGRVYTLGNTGVLACWDAKSGDVVWKVETLADFAAKNLFFGVSTSPIVVGDTVVVMVGGPDAGVVAFDKATGKVAWKATSDPASYAGPTLLTTDPKQLVLLTGTHVRSLAPDGKLLWSFPFKDRLNESSTTPVRVGDLIVASSVTAGSVGLKLPTADGQKPEQVWKNAALTIHAPYHEQDFFQDCGSHHVTALSFFPSLVDRGHADCYRIVAVCQCTITSAATCCSPSRRFDCCSGQYRRHHAQGAE